MGVVQKAPLILILNHPHLLPPPHKGEERRPIRLAQRGVIPLSVSGRKESPV